MHRCCVGNHQHGGAEQVTSSACNGEMSGMNRVEGSRIDRKSTAHLITLAGVFYRGKRRHGGQRRMFGSRVI